MNHQDMSSPIVRSSDPHVQNRNEYCNLKLFESRPMQGIHDATKTTIVARDGEFCVPQYKHSYNNFVFLCVSCFCVVLLIVCVWCRVAFFYHVLHSDAISE